MVVSSRDEWAGMDTSVGKSGDSNDADGWNRGKVDVTSGCESCTKVDAKVHVGDYLNDHLSPDL